MLQVTMAPSVNMFKIVEMLYLSQKIYDFFFVVLQRIFQQHPIYYSVRSNFPSESYAISYAGESKKENAVSFHKGEQTLIELVCDSEMSELFPFALAQNMNYEHEAQLLQKFPISNSTIHGSSYKQLISANCTQI